MSRKDTKTLSYIRYICELASWNEKILYSRARMVLGIYRHVCWFTAGRAEEVREELLDIGGHQLDGALIYLETFAPDDAKEHFEAKVRGLFETKWMMELVEWAMLRMREYPCKGDLYCSILSKCYLSRFEYRETEMLELLDMERSSFYDRKKEAILLFGLSLWGYAIPKLKGIVSADDMY